MSQADPSAHRVTTVEALEALYGVPVGASLIKELDHISAHYRAFIDHSVQRIVKAIEVSGLAEPES